MAPEIIDTKQDSYSMAADVYSFGVLMYELITEKQPYSNDERFNQPWNIARFVTSGERLPIPESCPIEYSKLLVDCWAHKAENRPTFAAIVASLETLLDRIFPNFRAKHSSGKSKTSDIAPSVSFTSKVGTI